jgi:hypothetical protein
MFPLETRDQTEFKGVGFQIAQGLGISAVQQPDEFHRSFLLHSGLMPFTSD